MELLDREEPGNLLAFLTGALVGAGIALLFAPQSGSQTLGRLRDYADRAKEGLDDAIDRSAEALDSAKQRGQEFVEQGKESLRQAGRSVKGSAEEGTHRGE